MKRRGVFKKTVNRQQSNEQRAMSNEQRAMSNRQQAISARANNNNIGEFYCGVWEQNISQCVCIVRDTRNHCAFEAACPKKEAA